ncbi:MAG: DUF1553 domain-containing protein [Verrucomicrobiota bacterium]
MFFITIFAGRLFAGEPAERVDFNFQIRPLLSDRCFKCHGPDAKSRKADLRLDVLENAIAVRDEKTGTRAIVPGKPEMSEVIRRITSTDPDEQMPPPDSHLKISAEEIALMREWIKQGAEYKAHWAFNPVQKISPPSVRSSAFTRLGTGTQNSDRVNAELQTSRNPIDQFVLARLQKEKLKPTSEASKETLIRRLAFSLTGLPPSLKQIDDFRNDTSTNAYEKLVEQFLASPAYGEQMARDWLDLARYADTYGYQMDFERDMFQWRDWVIRAFNQNLSYDKFITWQIAGDLLADATDEQILATAFNRLHRQTNEGGSIEEEFRNEYVSDRVHTFGTAFLGLTMECCRCHDHKYDPIKQKEYYQMSAFFNNIDESGLYSYFTHATPTPTMLLYGDGQKEKHAALKKQISEAEKKLTQIEKSADARFQKWQVGRVSPLRAGAETENEDGAHGVTRPTTFSFENITDNKTPESSGKLFASLAESPKQVEGRFGKALQFDGESSASCKEVGNFKRTDPFTISLWLKPTEKQERAVVFSHSKSWTDSGSRGYELILENGTPQFALIHFWPGNAVAIRARNSLVLNEWTHLTMTYDGSSRATGLKLFRNGEATETEVVHDNLTKDIFHRAEWGDSEAGNIPLTLAARFRDSGFKNGLIDEFQIFDRELTAVEVKSNLGRDEFHLVPFQKENNKDAVERVPTTEYQTALAELKQLRDAENNFVNDISEIMVMRESPTRRQTYLLKRGAYDARGEPVEPGTPEGIFPFPKNYPKNRLGLARWLVDEKNPLTARVVVNRIWKMHFGRGIVATPEDFGSQGQLPTHPDLLDWLANHFIESGWDVKKLHKLIVTSATYRQSSVASPETLATDPENRLLARGPKQRLPAEEIRDEALAVSGLLSPKLGGPSVKPYQPAGLWESSGTGKTYAQDTGEKLYRRSLYTFRRRTSPPPSMLIFDATSHEVCTAKRETTTTPLQALVLLNDPQFIEASRVIAEKIIRDESGSIENAFRSVVGRSPLPRENEILRQLYQEQLELFAKNGDAAKKYLATGEHARDAKLPEDRVAAMTVLVNTLMNYDEFVMKR